MDQVKIGKFIAELRRREGLTQEALGEKLGVTNKTVSRWENGNYMPDIEMLQLLGEILHVSINEILAGQLLTNEEFRSKADENIAAVAKESAFSFEERKNFWKSKWRKDHTATLVALAAADAGYAIVAALTKPSFVALLPLIMLVEYVWQRNRMMIYVEHKLYD